MKSHYSELLSINDENKLYYNLNITINQNIDVRSVRHKIRNKEYEKLDEETKNKLSIENKDINIQNFIKHPIVVKNKYNYEKFSEKLLKQLILEDLTSFMQ